jgi:hypothetical protein
MTATKPTVDSDTNVNLKAESEKAVAVVSKQIRKVSKIQF